MSEDHAEIQRIQIPEQTHLRKKETFEYITPENTYQIELFINQDGTCYAIGVPKDGGKIIVYGSNVFASADMALQNVIDKISRDSQFGLSQSVTTDDGALDE